MLLVMRSIVLVCCLGWVGCDQFAAFGIQESESDGGADDASEASVRDAAIRDLEDGSADAAAPDAATPDAATLDPDAECAAVTVAQCNPVTNEGCPASLQMQCAVSFDAHLTGYCIFFSGGPPPALGGACLNTVLTESCPPKSTCVAERCRQLCFCDPDCEPGLCCKQPLQSTGFKVCGDC